MCYSIFNACVSSPKWWHNIIASKYERITQKGNCLVSANSWVSVVQRDCNSALPFILFIAGAHVGKNIQWFLSLQLFSKSPFHFLHIKKCTVCGARKMIKQHKILFWNQSTYCMGFLGFVFVQLDYNLDPHSAQRRRRLCFHCSLNPQTFTAK